MISSTDGPLAGCRIGLLTASASRLGGGVFEAVIAHAALIRTLGGEPSVFALHDAFSDADAERLGDTDVRTFPVLGPRQIGFSPSLRSALIAADLDCLHLHGIWMYPSAAGARWAARTQRPYFVSPHGMLDPWITARGRWKKTAARLFYERASWNRATCLHGLTTREGQDIARECGRRDSVIVPNAGPNALRAPPAVMPPPVFAYIGRIHSKKNLPALVAGWTAAARPVGARLVIAGWGDDDAVADLRTAIAGSDGSADFIGPAYGAQKAELLGMARFVVLPSHSEGLPMAILEGWAQGVPVVMTSECNLPEGFASGAAIECGFDAPAIASAVTSALGLQQAQWAAMSAASLALARGRFSTDAIAAEWGRIYAWALGQRGANDEPA